MTQQELVNLSEDERRRYENSHLGDSLDDKIEFFLSSYQDCDYNNSNREISGLHVSHISANRSQLERANYYQGVVQEEAADEDEDL